MSAIIKDALNSVQLTERIINYDAFVNDATSILAKGKASKMPNISQGHYFAIHLACLRNSIEFDANYLQKRSTLNPKLYQSTLQFLLNALDDPTSVITTDSISKYYGSPDKLKETIEDIQSAANDSSPLASLAAAYQITQMSGLKICGTIGVMASLWAQPLDLFKDSCTKIKPFCVPSKIKEAGKIIQEEIKQTKASKLFQKELSLLKRTSSSPRLSNSAKKVSSSESNKSNTYSTSNSATNTHPLMLFNCSRDGPAFGPIIF